MAQLENYNINLDNVITINFYLIISKAQPCKFCDWLINLEVYKTLLKTKVIPISEKIFDWFMPQQKLLLDQLKRDKGIRHFPCMEIQFVHSNLLLENFFFLDTKTDGYKINLLLINLWKQIIQFDGGI